MTRYARLHKHEHGYMVSFPGTTIMPQTAPNSIVGTQLAREMAEGYTGKWPEMGMEEMSGLCEVRDLMVSIQV